MTLQIAQPVSHISCKGVTHAMQQFCVARQLAKSCAAPRGAACVHYGATSSDVEALFHENLVRMMHIAVRVATDDGAGSGML